MTIGQIHYFEDEQVTMSGSAPNTRGESDIITEVVAQLTDEWSMSGEMQIDPYASNNQMSSVQLRYRGDDGGVFTIGHRYRRDIVGQQTGIEQVDVSAKVPVSKNWSVIGRYYRSIADGRTLEGLAGVEYDSCCWATRFVARNFINDINADSRNMAFFWQIELKGLGQFGQNSDSLLERSINGLSL
jgi:LPS-assembly protein